MFIGEPVSADVILRRRARAHTYTHTHTVANTSTNKRADQTYNIHTTYIHRSTYLTGLFSNFSLSSLSLSRTAFHPRYCLPWKWQRMRSSFSADDRMFPDTSMMFPLTCNKTKGRARQGKARPYSSSTSHQTRPRQEKDKKNTDTCVVSPTYVPLHSTPSFTIDLHATDSPVAKGAAHDPCGWPRAAPLVTSHTMSRLLFSFFSAICFSIALLCSRMRATCNAKQSKSKQSKARSGKEGHRTCRAAREGRVRTIRGEMGTV